MSENLSEILKSNLLSVRDRMEKACIRAGRETQNVELVAVSKLKPIEDIKFMANLGQIQFGENYVQELNEKYKAIGNRVKWHMIGHLQTNKVKDVVGKTELIHSVDSLHLAKKIDRESEKKGLITNILIQINAACEDTKFGLKKEETLKFVEELSELKHIKVKGLMTSAPFTTEPEENRGYFRIIKNLSVDIMREKYDNIDMSILSMGMTSDFEIAIEEGATLVRVGTALFGERKGRESAGLMVM